MLDKILEFLRDIWDHFKPILFVYPYEEMVVLRGGKYHRSLKSGWHLRIPFVDDYFQDNIAIDTMGIKEVNVTTLDGKTITVGCEFDLKIINIRKAILEAHDWRSNLLDISRGILSDYIEEYTWDDLRKKTTKNAIEKKIQKRSEEFGVEISNFNFTDKSVSRVITLFGNNEASNKYNSK